jgi:hypothetical protein
MTKKCLLLGALFSLFLIIPFLIMAQGLVPCGHGNPCTIGDFFTMLHRIYNFLVTMIATPLAIIALTVGGIILMTSAGNPNLVSLGKKILWAAIIGLFLVWGSWVIINFIMEILGYSGTWHTL